LTQFFIILKSKLHQFNTFVPSKPILSTYKVIGLENGQNYAS